MLEDKTNEPTSDTKSTAFKLLGNEIRSEIIRTLGEARAQKESESVLSFSELRSRINADLAPSQLNYHLQQLAGNLIKKTDGGYTTVARGFDLYEILRAGVVDRRQEPISVDADFDCYYCQAPVKARFSERKGIIECPNCDFRYLSGDVAPPLRAFEDKEMAFEQFSKYAHHTIIGYAQGICKTCGNAMRTDLIPPEAVPQSGVKRSKVYVDRLCGYCGNHFQLRVGVSLLLDHSLRLFCLNHGVDVLTTPYWKIEFAATDKYVTVNSRDPWEVKLAVTFCGDTLELVVDDYLNILERNHQGGSDIGSQSMLSGVKSGVCLRGTSESVEEVLLPNNEACVKYLRRHRWPGEITCPHCGGVDTIKKGRTNKDAQRYRCQTCDSIFNDLTGTVFAERRLSVSEMFHIIKEMGETETAQIARQLDRHYTSVLDFVHEIHEARDSASESNIRPC